MAETSVAECRFCGGGINPVGKAGRKFCSSACYHNAQRAGVVKIGRDRTRNYSCHRCGQPAYRSLSQRRDGTQSDKVFCGRACYDAHRAAGRGNCPQCGVVNPRAKNKYCSQSCKVAANRPAPCKCLNCGVLFSAIKWHGTKRAAVNGVKTCSPECRRDWIRKDPERKRKIGEAFQGSKHPNWQGGSHRDGFRGHDWERLSESIRDRAGRCCEHCGKSEADNGRRLDVNHKEPFHQSTNKRAANRPANLEALCRPCHTVTDWKWRKEHPVQTALSFRVA